MSEKLTVHLISKTDAKEEKKVNKLSFLKENGALKKWFIASEILSKKE